jgi:endonuclease YncB( thermonuclease family)
MPQNASNRAVFLTLTQKTPAGIAAGLLTLLSLLSFALFPNRCAALTSYTATISRVIDGDTAHAIVKHKRLTIRLYGIDAPEKSQPYGTSATLQLRRLTQGTTLTLLDHGPDRYGRHVAEILLPNQTNVNREMLARGAAHWYHTYAPKASSYAAAQRQAQQLSRGLWAKPNPTPPWDYRRSRRATARRGKT